MIAFAKPDNILAFSKRQASIIFASASNEWYTPSQYAKAACEVMGSIDLDPASCTEANRVIGAQRYYSESDNGLLQDWTCESLWLNPPYGTTNGKSNQGIWTRRLIDEYHKGNVEQAILLVNAKTDTRWFEALWQFPICFTHGRVNYYTEKQTTAVGNTNGSCFIYMGANEQKFIEVFSRFGHVARSVSPRKVQPINPSLWEVSK